MSSVSPLKERPSAGQLLAAQRPQRRAHLVEEDFLLGGVDLAHLFEQLEIDALLLRDPVKGRHILGEAGAAVAEAGAQELGPDAGVKAHAGGDVFDVRVDRFGEVGDGVDEGDFERQKSIGGVLDDLGALRGGDEQFGRIVRAQHARQGVGWLRSSCRR